MAVKAKRKSPQVEVVLRAPSSLCSTGNRNNDPTFTSHRWECPTPFKTVVWCVSGPAVRP
jgi:hypothetical protein